MSFSIKCILLGLLIFKKEINAENYKIKNLNNFDNKLKYVPI